MPWQRIVADVAGEVGDPDPETGVARMRYPLVLLVVPRRAGKTILTLATHLERLTIGPARRGFYTAQTRNDAAEAWRDDWVPRVEASPFRRAVKIRNSNGSEVDDAWPWPALAYSPRPAPRSTAKTSTT